MEREKFDMYNLWPVSAPIGKLKTWIDEQVSDGNEYIYLDIQWFYNDLEGLDLIATKKPI